MKQKTEDKGSALAFLLLVIFVITLVVFSIATLSHQNLENVSGKYWEERARYGALAGVQRALTQLRNDSTWDHTFAGPGPASDWNDVPLAGDPNVTFSLQVVNRLSDANGAWAPDNKTWIPPFSVWINSVGQLGFRRSSGVSSIISVVSRQRPVFNHAVFGVNGVVLNDFRAKAWHPANEGDGFAGVGTNSVAASAIELRTNSFVDGDVEVGVNGDPVVGIFNDGTSTVDGDERAAQESKLITGFESPIPVQAPAPSPPIEVSAAYVMTPGVAMPTLDPGNAGGAGTVTVPGPGEYYIQGSLNLDNDQLLLDPTVTSEEPAVIYVDQNVNVLNNSQVNWDTVGGVPGDPRRLQIYTLERIPNSEAAIHGSNEVSMMMAGATMTTELHNSTFYGGIIAQNFTGTNSVVFYDIRNKDVPMDGGAQLTIMSTTIQTRAEAEANARADTTTGPAPPGANPPPPTTNPVQPPPPSVGDPANPGPSAAPPVINPTYPPTQP